MSWEAPLLAIPFLLMCMAAMWLAGVAWRSERAPGALSFALLMQAAMVWLLGSAVKEFVPSLAEKEFWLKIQFIGVVWAPTLWLAFTVEFGFSQTGWLERRGGWLWIMPMVTMLLALSNDLHGLIWQEVDLTAAGLVYRHGWWFWIFVVYSYAATLSGAVMLAIATVNFPVYHRRQAGALLIGLLMPWIANAGYWMGWTPREGLDLTPYALAFSGFVYAWSLFRLGLYDPLPLARAAILEHIGEGYLVLDERHRVVDSNRFARDLLGLETLTAQRQPVDRLLDRWPALLDLLQSERSETIDLIADATRPFYVEASISTWQSRHNRRTGRILILRDVTRRRQVEEQLRESEQTYRLLVTSSPVGILMTDQNGRITYASPEVEDILRLDASQIIGMLPADLVEAPYREISLERIRKLLEDHERLSPVEYRLLRGDGRAIWAEVNSSPVIDREGCVRGILIVMRNIEERKQLELRVQRNYEQQAFVNDLLQILYRPADLTEALHQAMDRLGSFTGASRVYICEDSPDGLETTIVDEWCKAGILPRAQEGALVRYAAIPSWRAQMNGRGMVLVSKDITTPEDLLDFLLTWNVHSLVAFPIFGSESQPFGFLGLDECEVRKVWGEEDLSMLWSVSRILSTAVIQRHVEEDERREKQMVEALRDTASAMNSTLNLDEVFDRVLINLQQVVPHDAASIAMLEGEDQVRFVRFRGFDEAGSAWMQNTHIPITERETFRQMAEHGEPVIISDTWMDKVWKLYPEFSWVRSYAGVPIKIKGKVAGFINLDSTEPDFFTPDLGSRLQTFADQAAIAIDNARLYDAARRRADEMAIINRIALTLTAGLEMGQVMVSLFEQCRRVLPVDVFSVALYDADTNMIEYPLFYSDEQFHVIEPRDIRTRPGLSGEVILTRKTIWIPDSLDPDTEQKHQILRLGGRPARSYVGVPLVLIDRVVGVITMQNYQPHAYTAEQVTLLETIATQAAIAVQNARLYDQMKQLAITDPVTLLHTRRHFTSLGHREVERAMRYGRSLSVLMVDIDRFKRVNDTYGHGAGDLVLQGVARLCQQALRATDIVGRWGGEEFVVVLPEADEPGARLIAERVRRMVEESEVTVPQGSLRVTVSVGIATMSQAIATLETLVDCADRAMYAAKQAGRNQVKTCRETTTC